MVIDVEATGLSKKVDRITEIGIIELDNFEPTGRFFHSYIFSGKEIPQIVTNLTGITNQLLKDKPKFSDIADMMIEFIGDKKLVAHNASYDMGMINAELKICNKAQIPAERFIDTLRIAREKYPGRKASQDAIMSRLGIDASMRDKHGAIVDSYLLSLMYKAMCQEEDELFDADSDDEEVLGEIVYAARKRQTPLKSLLNSEEKLSHEKFILKMEKDYKKTSLWNY